MRMRSRSSSKVFARLAPGHFLVGRGASFLFILTSAILLLISFAAPQALSGLRIGTVDIVAPLLKAISQPFYNAAQFVDSVSGFAGMRAENAQLRAENARLREWYQTALVLQAENHSLKDLLNVKTEPHHNFITTRIVADAGTAFVKSALIAAGQNDGVKKDQPVLSGEGLIGRVIESGSSAARVLLITDFNSRVPVLVEGSRQKAILYGTNEDFPVLRHLPPDSEVTEGMRIVTSGHGGVYPPGLPVGRVVAGADGQLSVKLFSDMNRVMHVRVLDVSIDPNLRSGALDMTP